MPKSCCLSKFFFLAMTKTMLGVFNLWERKIKLIILNGLVNVIQEGVELNHV